MKLKRLIIPEFSEGNTVILFFFFLNGVNGKNMKQVSFKIIYFFKRAYNIISRISIKLLFGLLSVGNIEGYVAFIQCISMKL